MSGRWNTGGWTTWRALVYGAVLLGAACSPSGSEPRDATSVEPEHSTTETAGSESPPGPEATAADEADAPDIWAADSSAVESSEVGSSEVEPSAIEPSPAEASTAEPSSDGAGGGATPRPNGAAEGNASSGQEMIDFFQIGRGDRVADLGGLSGYSLAPIRRAVGPSGVVYVRRRLPPPSDPADSSANDLGTLVWMNTPDEAPLIKDATRLNAVTLLFAYHALVAAGRDRQKVNAAVFRALVPGGVYIIADNAAPPGSGISAVRELNRIEESVIRDEVQAAGFEFVEAGNFVTSAAAALRRPPSSQYVLKFKKP
jgi:predicted methyltransferase